MSTLSGASAVLSRRAVVQSHKPSRVRLRSKRVEVGRAAARAVEAFGCPAVLVLPFARVISPTHGFRVPGFTCWQGWVSSWISGFGFRKVPKVLVWDYMKLRWVSGFKLRGLR